MSGTKGGPTVELSVVTRSRSRQGAHVTPPPDDSEPEECGQLIEFEDTSATNSELGSDSILEISAVEGDIEEQTGDDMAEARGLGISPPKFRGGLEENVEEYLQSFERISKANAWTAEKKLVILPCYLEGAALKWYENLEQAEGEGLTWATVKEKMRNAFQSIAWEEQMEYKLRMRMQGEEEQVESYIQDVLNLCSKLDGDMSERCKIKHVLRGLKPSLLEKVMIMENDTLENLLANVRKVQTARYMAGQRVDQLITELPRRRAEVPEEPRPVSSGSLESKIENLTSEFSKFSMRLLEGSRRSEERGRFAAHSRGQSRGWGRGQPRGGARVHFQEQPPSGRGSHRGQNRGRTADGRVICYKCNRVGHFAINCHSSQPTGTGNEDGGR